MSELPLLPPGTGVMLCGHGSRNRFAVEEFAVLAERVRARLPGVPVEHGYLEFADPVIHHGLDRLRQRGVDHVLAVPGMLFAAGHAKNDIPTVLNTYAAMHPGFTISYGRELGIDTRMLRAAADRIAEAEAAAGPAIARHETLLLLVGRGASDPDANSNVAKMMRMLWEGMGFGWGETAYSGVTFPLVTPALEHAVRLGYRRIIVMPYFLFTGVLVKRIQAAADAVAAAHPELQIVNAPYLNDHPLVIDTVLDRLAEILVGKNLMNCQMCKYRAQVLGFEAEHGLPQESHHHHVEGIGGGMEGCPCSGDCDSSCRDEAFCRAHGLEFTPLHDHDHHHGEGVHHHGDGVLHSHAPKPHALAAGPALVDLKAPSGHHHPAYPGAAHPLGPSSLPKVQGRLARALRGDGT